MSESLAVYLDGQFVGTMMQTRAGAIGFRYDDEYRGRTDATPLSLSMPLARGEHKNRPARAFLQGLLPDSAGRLDELAREFRVSARNPFALLSHMGMDAAGAVQIIPEGATSSDAAARQGDVKVIDDEELAAVVADVIANRETWGRRDNANVRWSLPGAQPKIALFRTDEGHWATPNDSTPTTHILKPAVPPYSDHHINEYMTMAAARHLGLEVAEDFLINTVRGDAAFVSVRYDRTERDGRWMRLHQEDICQALAVLPEHKYQSDGGPGIAKIGDLFRASAHTGDRQLNAEKFFDAIVFNFAAVGTDAHAKNYSLMLAGDHSTLAPLYDLGSHAPYPSKTGGGALALAMSIDGEYDIARISKDSLARAGVRLGLSIEHARDRVEHITGGIVDAYAEAAEDARAILGDVEFIGVMMSSIDEHATQRGWHEKRFNVLTETAPSTSATRRGQMGLGRTVNGGNRGSFGPKTNDAPTDRLR